MNQIVVFILIAISIMVLVGGVAYWRYKGSIVFTMTLIVVNTAGPLTICAYVIAVGGYKHLLWAVPAVCFYTVLNFVLLNKFLTKPVNSLKQDIVDMLSVGQLNFNFDEAVMSSKNEFGEMAKSLTSMKNKTKLIIEETQEVSNFIEMSARLQSESAMQISKGANEQATATEEISATLQEITASNQQNKDNANHTASLSKSATNSMIKMEELTKVNVESVTDIIEKIKFVNDIAFQTNILSLNASVEAARAGEQGRGFAVVANEVRNLAESSKKASDEIHNLSQSTIQKSNESEQFVLQLLKEITKTASLVETISLATNEQSAGTEQINVAIQDLNSVSQQNAASSEELASSSEELSEKAKNLTELISFFKID